MQDFEKLFNETKLIAILRGVPEDTLCDVLDALYKGGVRLAEITYDRTGATPDSVTAENIARAVKYTEGRMLIGAGTVLTTEQVELTANAGGRFIISPDTDEDVIRATKAAGLVSIPGAITPTEVRMAHKAGADFVKLFPIDLYGPKYIKTLSAPLSNVKVLAVNGITDQNMNDYLAAGAVGVGVGSGIVRKDLIAAGDFAGIVEAARAYTSKLA